MAARKSGIWIALLLGLAGTQTPAAILPTALEARVGANYQPVDADERAIWKGLARLEAAVRSSPQRLIAPELDAYIRGVVERLIGRPAADVRIYVMRDAAPNAAMLPSGMMIVNSGLLVRVRDEAQLAAVLAHEAGHYFRKHSLDLYRDERRKSALTSSQAFALQSFDDSNGSWRMINQAILLSSSRFSRDLESEADAYGLMLMAHAGYRLRAAPAVWEQLSEERRASAAARRKRYRDVTSYELSTHPPTQIRMTNLADTADYLTARRGPEGAPEVDGWAEVIRPYAAALLREQIYLNDAGASLYLLETRARDGWTGLLRFYEGEVYRLRDAKGDALHAASAYSIATTLADAPPEAWAAHGYQLLKSGVTAEAQAALNRYLAMHPGAPDTEMVRFTLNQGLTTPETGGIGGRLTVDADSRWRRLSQKLAETRWEEVWTRNGPQADRMALIGGVPDGKSIIFEPRSAEIPVPVFRADMTMHDLVSMLEVSYRLKGVTSFDVESVGPATFLEGRGVRLRYHYASGIVFAKRGVCVMRVIGRKLYAMKLEGVSNSSFDVIAAEFDNLVDGARLR